MQSDKRLHSRYISLWGLRKWRNSTAHWCYLSRLQLHSCRHPHRQQLRLRNKQATIQRRCCDSFEKQRVQRTWKMAL
jgi:hypothetical protein